LEQTRKLTADIGRDPLVVPTDITVPDQVEALARATLEAFGGVDVLVNNSGVGGPSAPLWEVDPADWESTMAVNVTGTYLCCRAFLPAMVARRSGSVVIIGSTTGKRPLVGRAPYAASKMALVGLTRTLAVEAGPYGVRVNLISPGPVEGERMEWVIGRQAEALGVSVEEARARFISASPLGRLVPPEDVAAATVFLASDRAASITGEDLNVSAGVVMY
jgi:NAD(P)-dependent dehydrogenase (short-subunit alcohol dehydrogenase family)